MPGHLAGKSPPARACGCRVIATMTDLVCASVACAGSYSDILGEARREQLHAGRLEAPLERAQPHGGPLGAPGLAAVATRHSGAGIAHYARRRWQTGAMLSLPRLHSLANGISTRDRACLR